MMSFGRPPRPAHAASTTPAAANAIAQPQQEPAASLKDALADAEKRVQELRKIWQVKLASFLHQRIVVWHASTEH